MTIQYRIQIWRDEAWHTYEERFPTEKDASIWCDRTDAWSKSRNCWLPLRLFKTRIIPEFEKHS